MMEDDDDFEEQLKQEELQKLREEGKDPGTYKDKDGTEYEWDQDKKAWFPKITEDFIAQYQMNYGSHPATESQGEGDTQKDSSEQQNYDYNEYYKYYGNYYQGQGEKKSDENEEGTCSEDKSDSGDTKTSIPSLEGLDVNSEEYAKRYHEYMSYYYGDDYANYYNQVEVQGEVQSEGQGQNEKKGKKRKKKGENKPENPPPKREEGWFDVDDEKNTNVYVSGLPSDITNDEFKELMTKYGLIMFDPILKQPKIKLYVDDEGNPKGDGRCCFIKSESVDLALKLLDGSDVRGSTVHVEKAQFSLKGKYDPSKKKKKLSNKEKRKFKEKQQKLFDWRPEKKLESCTRPKHERVMVLKNMFSPKEFETDPMLINDLRDDAREECSKLGEVKFVKLYDNHPEGVITVTMKTPEEADEVIKSLNGRWFAKKKITAETWDGRTKFEIEESDAEREKRLKNWGKFLETENKEENRNASTESADRQVDSKTENTNNIDDSQSKMNISEESGSTKKETLSENSDSVEMSETKPDENG